MLFVSNFLTILYANVLTLNQSLADMAYLMPTLGMEPDTILII